MKRHISFTQHMMKKHSEAEARRIVRMWTIIGEFTTMEDGSIMVTLVQMAQVPMGEQFDNIDKALDASVAALWGRAWNMCREIESEK